MQTDNSFPKWNLARALGPTSPVPTPRSTGYPNAEIALAEDKQAVFCRILSYRRRLNLYWRLHILTETCPPQTYTHTKSRCVHAWLFGIHLSSNISDENGESVLVTLFSHTASSAIFLPFSLTSMVKHIETMGIEFKSSFPAHPGSKVVDQITNFPKP